MRNKKPEQRRLAIEWSTQKWVPRIVVRPANRGNWDCLVVDFELDRFGLFGKKPQKSREATVLWMVNGSRPTWEIR